MLKSIIIKSFVFIKDLAYYYKLTFQYRRVIRKQTKNIPKKLHKNQIAEIKEYFSKYGFYKIKTSWHDFYFSSNSCYSVKYIPEDIFHASISNKLNQMKQWPSLLDKNLLYSLFKDYMQPKVVLKNINGFYYINNEIVTENAAIERVSNEIDQMVIKPSIDSGNGQKVISFTSDKGNTSYNELSIKKLLNSYGKDFIIQIVVEQDLTIKSLNPSSLNTVRALSYLNKDGVHVLSSVIRIGKRGSFTDNFEAGGIACGINENGELKKYGYLFDGTKTLKADNGTLFNSIKIPCFKKLVAQIKKMHLLIPYFQLVSWDIALDINGSPILIEYNTYHQNITLHQLANGPLFGAFTEEILLLGTNEKL